MGGRRSDAPHATPTAVDPAAQQPTHGSTRQAGVVGGIRRAGGGWRCSFAAQVPQTPCLFSVVAICARCLVASLRSRRPGASAPAR